MLELAALTQTKYITIMDGVIGWLLQSVALVKLCIFNKPNIGCIRVSYCMMISYWSSTAVLSSNGDSINLGQLLMWFSAI